MFKNLDKIAARVAAKATSNKAMIAVGLAAVGSNAMAALPTGLATALAGVETDIGLLMDEYWPLIVLGIATGILIRWSKKGGRAV